MKPPPSLFPGPQSSQSALPQLCNKGEALRRTLWFGRGPGGAVRLGARGERGGLGYFWCEVRTAQRFPQPGGGVSRPGAGSPRGLGSTDRGAPWRRGAGPTASPNPPSPLAQAAELGGDAEPHPGEGAARGGPGRRRERWGPTSSTLEVPIPTLQGITSSLAHPLFLPPLPPGWLYGEPRGGGARPWLPPRRAWFVLTRDSLDQFSSSGKGARRLRSLVLTSLCSVTGPERRPKETGEAS